MTAVSVITPTYNAAKYIEETYHSLKSQSFTDWEWVITDDGSGDETPAILRELAKTDSRLRLEIGKGNTGPAVARNRSIERASGRYIAFLDADDQWLPRKLEKQILFMADNEYAFTHTWYRSIDEAGNTRGSVIKAPDKLSYADMLKSNQVGCLTAIYDAQVLGKIKMPLLRKRQDYGLWLALLKKTSHVYCLPENLALYRTGMNSISSNKVELLKYNWALFRDIEKFSFPKAAYYLGWNILRKVMK